jgi:methyl-accepting chemotaxis protein
VSFTQRYLLRLIAPPAAVTIPLAFLFVAQVIALSTSDAIDVALLLLWMYVVTALAYGYFLTPYTRRIEEAITEERDASQELSDCLRITIRAAVIALGLSGIVFALLCTWLVMQSAEGFGYFIVAASIAAFPGIAWAYAAGKRFLAALGRGRYIGPELSIGKKIAIVFIGSFIVSSAALVELTASKVLIALERLAIASSSERFQRIYDTANLSAQIDPKILDDLRLYIPSDYALHLISRGGQVTDAGAPLTPDEVAAIRRIGNGDSASFSSQHVVKFAKLKDGSILALSIPWEPYRKIPRQITMYTFIIALLTSVIFSMAALFLARDVTTPLRKLRTTAAEMAQGNFDVAPRVFSDDEVGELAESFGEMRTNLRRLLGRVGGSGSTITEGVRVITGGTESLLTRARDQARLTENSTTSLENVRGGIRSVLAAADTVASLTEDASSRALQLQASAEQVAKSTDRLFQSVEKTSASTSEMDASMREISKRTGVLAGIGEEALSFVTEMDSTISELRDAAQSTAAISRHVSEDAEAGGDAVAKMVEGINASRDLTNSTATTIDELQGSVGQINQILTVIEEITTRTNLLALNAAIIAAQAGEQGLGFGVVADEIRELAERTRGSTKEIAAIIKAVQSGSRQTVAKINEGVERVEANVELAENASLSLRKIVNSAARSYDMATKISRALEEQAAASRHLHDVTSRMSDAIAEINRGTREQAHGTELLAQEAERVREIAAQVKSATNEQSQAGHGITIALEKIADDARNMRDHLQRQMSETERIAQAARTMLDIAQENDAVAREFNATVQNLVLSGRDFESEVARFRYRGGEA